MKYVYPLFFIMAALCGGCQSLESFSGDIETILSESSRETGLSNLVVGELDPSIKMIRQVHVSGSHRDLGYLEGVAARKAGWDIPLIPDGDRALNDRIIAFYEDVYPFHIQKVTGTAEAYGVHWRDVDFRIMERGFYDRFGTEGYNAAQTVGDGFPEGSGSCSVIGLTLPPEAGSVPMIGRNLDTFNITGFLVLSEMEGVYRTLGMSGECFYDYVVDGINEKGLFIGEMSITDPAYHRRNLSPNYPGQPSVYMLRMMRIVLDTCANVDEAVSLFRRVPVWFSYDLWHFYLADSSGNRCVIEYDKEGQLVVIRDDAPFLVSTNTPLMEGDDALELCPRWSVAHGVLAEGKVHTQQDLYRLMGDISVSRRNPWLQQWVPLSWLRTLRTVWTTVYNLDSGTLDLHHWEDGYSRRSFSLRDPAGPDWNTSGLE